MPCFYPLRAFKGPQGVTLKRREAYGDLAFAVACGQCIGCRLARVQSWAIRCVHEASLHESSCFVTLTYGPEYVPADGSVDVREWQLFAKRLRKRRGRFRFLHCGEYGGATYRPHYHALLFGVDFRDRVELSRAGLFTSPELAEVWGLGQVSVGDVSYQSAAYVARYCVGKLSGAAGAEKYRRIDAATGEEFFVRPEYATMSRRPGLGAGWYERFRSDVFPADECVIEGRKVPVPDYYFRKLEVEDPSMYAALKDARRARALARGAAPIGTDPRGTGDLSPERLETRREIAEAWFAAKCADV